MEGWRKRRKREKKKRTGVEDKSGEEGGTEGKRRIRGEQKVKEKWRKKKKTAQGQ